MAPKDGEMMSLEQYAEHACDPANSRLTADEVCLEFEALCSKPGAFVSYNRELEAQSRNEAADWPETGVVAGETHMKFRSRYSKEKRMQALQSHRKADAKTVEKEEFEGPCVTAEAPGAG